MEEEKNSNDESQILEITRELTQLMIEKDTEGINEIVDANFTLTHITGYIQSKKNGLLKSKMRE